MDIWVYSFASVIIVSLISLIGIFSLLLRKNLLEKILLFLVSFAVGGLFGDAFIHLLPEAYKGLGINLFASSLVLFGIIFFFVLEKFIRWRHCHVPTSENHPHPVVYMNLIGDGAHNLIDGMLIGASYLVSIPIGISTTIAVVLHEIPQEIGDFGVLVNGGLTVRKALFFNFLTALAAVVGVMISLIVGPFIKDYASFMLPITAGGFLYIAGSDLIPELHHENELRDSFWQLFSILLGVAIMGLLLLIN
ncbi:ZIP family metal transporter [Candidatus Saganbacteria bacterium]|nr:ZIP family metal transporter [Candidatus Saganbacteria bacterium]